MQTRHISIGCAGVALLLLPALAGRQEAGAATGMTLTPSIIERDAVPGKVGSITIRNSLSKVVEVSIAPRPWLQSRSGAVTPNARRTLGNIKLSATRITMPANSARTIDVTLASAPASRSLYGSVEFRATPRGQAKGQIKVSYRLIGVLRLNPAANRRVFRLAAGSPVRQGRSIVLPVRSSGNTAAPITGSATVSGPNGGYSGQIQATRILPGYIVDVPIAPAAGLRKGKYTTTVTLRQGGKVVGKVKRAFRVG